MLVRCRTHQRPGGRKEHYRGGSAVPRSNLKQNCISSHSSHRQFLLLSISAAKKETYSQTCNICFEMVDQNHQTTASTGYQRGFRCEFKTYHTVPNKEGRLKVKPIIHPFEHEGKGQTDDAYALVINREFTLEDQSAPKSVTLRINSPQLLKAFSHVVGSYAAVASDFKSPFELTNPFQILVHYWDELDAYRREVEDDEARMHLNLLFQFMEGEVGPDRQKILNMISSGRVTFAAAWVIFRPGDILYTAVMDHSWLLRCRKTVYEENTKIGPYLEVHCTYTDHNGEDAGAAPYKVLLVQKRNFGGENPEFITGLPIFPRKYVHDDDLEAKLTRRGERFLELRGCSVQAYDGLAQYLREPPWSFWDYDMASADPVWLPYTVCALNELFQVRLTLI